MKRSITILSVLACLLITGAPALPAYSAQKLSIEQVQLSPPDMDVFVNSESTKEIAKEDVSASIGDDKLEVDSVSKQDKDSTGIFYAFLLDISGSIPQSSLNAAIRSISKVAKGMDSNDKLAVLTFGDKVNVISDGSKKPSETLRQLKGLKAKDQTTKFYSAMDKLIAVSRNAKGMRTVAVVVSDGVDDTDAGMTESQLTSILKNSGIAVYALQVGKVTKAQTKHLKKFIKISGGKVYRFSEKDAAKVIGSLVGDIDETSVIHLLGKKGMKVKNGDKLTLIVKGYAPLTWKLDKKSWEESLRTNPGQGIEAVKAEKKKESSDKAIAEAAEANDKRLNEELKRQRTTIIIAIGVVVIATAIVLAILLNIRRKNILKSYYEKNGLDEEAVEKLNREIKRKRRNRR